MDVIIENDDPYHHPHAEEEGLRVGEPAAIFPVGKQKRDLERTGHRFSFPSWKNARCHQFWSAPAPLQRSPLPGRLQPFPDAFTLVLLHLTTSRTTNRLGRWSAALLPASFTGVLVASACGVSSPAASAVQARTHGVSSITRQTQAMVLRQSVVSSIGRVLF